MKKPIIGISCNLYPATDDQDFSRGRDVNFLNVDYPEYIRKVDATPILLPVIRDTATLKHFVDTIDALLLSGGADLAPELYHQEILDSRWQGETERAHFEMELCRLTHHHRKPILGICRGVQLINVAFGGTLYQDLGTQCNLDNHRRIPGKPIPMHDVHLEPGSQLHRIIGKTTITVNSSHHQAVRTPAPGFSVTAKSDDGVIEGLETDDVAFLVGVQWHPERMEGPEADSLARYLVEMAYESNRLTR
jgi:putative glutamine amidotransferase